MFADGLPVLGLLGVFVLPSFHTVSGLLLLEPLQKGLVLQSDFNEFSPPLLPVERLLGLAIRDVERRFGVLHNI